MISISWILIPAMLILAPRDIEEIEIEKEKKKGREWPQMMEEEEEEIIKRET